MKRWRDHGEVQDSDEESIGDGKASESPQLLRKRARIQSDTSLEERPEPTPDLSTYHGVSNTASEHIPGFDLLPDAGEDHTINATEAVVATTDNKIQPESAYVRSLYRGSHPRHVQVVSEKRLHSHSPSKTSPSTSLRARGKAIGSLETRLPTQKCDDQAQSRSENGHSSRKNSQLSSCTPPPQGEPHASSDHGNHFYEAPPNLRTEVIIPVQLDYDDSSSSLSDPPDSPLPFEADSTPAVNPDEHFDARRWDFLTQPDPNVVRRTLRARQEKQLHPYLYDKTLYQQQCRERGLRPVRMNEQREPEMHNAFLSQDGAGFSSQPYEPAVPEMDIPEDVMDTQQSENRSQHVVSQRSVTVSEDEEQLPNMTTLLKHRDLISREARKRGKLHGSDSVRRLKKNLETPATHPREHIVPPSPPSSLENSISHTTFKRPRGLSPVLGATTIPTPVISSESRPSFLQGSQDRSDDSSPARRPGTNSVSRSKWKSVRIDSDSESESEPNINEVRLQKEKRRIRGVLPASWLKLDLKKRQIPDIAPIETVGRVNVASPPPSHLPRRGIGSKKVVPDAFRHDQPSHLELSSDTDMTPSSSRKVSAEQSPQQARLRLSPEHLTLVNHLHDSDDMESDFVDLMMASSARKRHVAPRRKPNAGKRQSRLADSSLRDETAQMARSKARIEDQNSTRPAAKRCPAKRRTTRTSKNTPPKLSVLDAEVASAPEPPQFIRLATRQARRAKDKARHSPSNKIIRLATSKDTEDATVTLRQWREGTIILTRNPVTSTRGPERQEFNATEPIQSSRQPHSPAPETPLRSTGLESQPSHHKLLKLPGQRRLKVTTRRPIVSTDALRPGRSPDVPDHSTKGLTSPIRRLKQRESNKRQPIQQYREAQHETREQDFFQQHRAAAFEQRVFAINDLGVARPGHTGKSTYKLPRLWQQKRKSPTAGQQASESPTIQTTSDSVAKTLPVRRRKRQAQRVDTETRMYRQPSEPFLNEDTSPRIEETGPQGDDEVLQGLGPWGVRYPTGFDNRPLPSGTYFHQSTFIGSGEFSEDLDIAQRNLDISAGVLRIYINGRSYDWSAWTEEVGDQMAQIPMAITAASRCLDGVEESQQRHDQVKLVGSNIEHMLRSVARYLAKCVNFLDPIDRVALVRRSCQLVEDLSTIRENTELWKGELGDARTVLLHYAFVIAFEIRSISRSPLVQTQLQLRCGSIVRQLGLDMADLVVSRLGELRDIYEDSRYASKRELGIRNDNCALSSCVILNHVLSRSDPQSHLLWDILNSRLCPEPHRLQTVTALDTVWHNVFTILPALQFDSTGMLAINQRSFVPAAAWSLPKQLLDRVLGLYGATSKVKSSTINDYVRVNLTRCSHLVIGWKWFRCEAALGSVYDFFARRGLSLLNNEEGKGSPAFLEHLAEDPDLSIQHEDRSFHVFLKWLASTIISMQIHQVLDQKKIGSLAWRFIPNHARLHQRDAEVQRSDLEALRNHYDLLCVLYFACPPTHRPRVELLSGLIDHATSHREACRVSVRAWSNLASFQVSTNEHTEALHGFADWFDEMIRATIPQYTFARTEAEETFKQAQAQGSVDITAEMLGRTVITNQRQIAATLIDLLSALKRAVRGSTNLQSAAYLARHSKFWQIISTFDPSERLLYSVIEEALEVCRAVIELQKKTIRKQESSFASEDSQDYGDSSALQEYATAQADGVNPCVTELTLALHDVLNHLVSNVFGAETAADDAVLVKTVDIWVHFAAAMITIGKHSWNNYIEDYSATAWSRLGDNNHRQKLTPYFLARVIETSGQVSNLPRNNIMTAWLRSMVDREASLKYQHQLTAALLNTFRDDVLLRNLPFVQNRASQEYTVSLDEFRTRRLSLLSSVLSNMRDSLDEHMHLRSRYQELRGIYSGILRQLMQAMKSNYQEMQTSYAADAVAQTVQGGYVDFVQQVVSFLQQYTADICPVDRFFIDSSAFPLPASDPTYVVGRLKSYVAKLCDSRTRKQLAVFILTVSERAAVDNQQVYLIQQLFTSMVGARERGDHNSPSLRYVLLTTIFPPYIEHALSFSCAWIMSVPILEATAKTIEDLLYTINMEDVCSRNAAVATVESVLRSSYMAITPLLQRPTLMKLPHIQRTLSAIMLTCKACLPACDYISRSMAKSSGLAQYARYFKHVARAVIKHLESHEEQFDALEMVLPAHLTQDWPDTRAFGMHQHQNAFVNDWYVVDDQYFVRRGNTSKEVVVNLDSREEQASLLRSAYAFCHSYETFNRHRPRESHTDHCGVSRLMV